VDLLGHAPPESTTSATAGRDAVLPLLGTKLAIPREPPALIDRPRLRQAVEAGLDKPVLLVSAGPGWGKTTLLSAWAHSTMTGYVIAWLTVEPADVGRQFWRYVHAALTAAGARGSDGEQLPAPRAASDDGYLILLVDALAAMAAPAVLILDDVQVLTDTQTLAGLGFLVRHAGTRLRLVLATRSKPALPLQRWRIRGELSELPAAQLAFTESEAKALLVRDDDANVGALGDQQVATLHARTEGWPAGLRLAELSMHDAPDRNRYVDQFGGGHGTVCDYLTDEVFALQTAETQDTLICSSILSRVCGELLDSLTGRSDGERMLAEFEHANAFVMPLGGREGWYRYRRLFGDLLFAQLHRQAPDRISDLHRRAAAWYVATGRHLLALRHALAGHDVAHASEVLAAHWHEFALAGDGDALRTPLPPPPLDAVRVDPAVALAYAADRLDIGDHFGATTFLRLADSHRHLVPSEDKERFALIVSAFRLTEAHLRGEVADVMPLAPRHLLEAEIAVAVEELTPRELTVMHYLQSPLSNAEIATELSLSVHTVKTHVRSIYRKLDVVSRQQAVRRARRLQLL
jgi:LuxR family maltose regulon positive regulatory protein